MTTTVPETRWPASRLGEALQALCKQSGLVSTAVVAKQPPAGRGPLPGQDLEHWIERLARSLGVEAEPVDAPYGQLDRLLSGAGPALLRLDGDGEARFLALLGSDGDRLSVVAPDHTVVGLPPELVRSALCREAEATAQQTVDVVLEKANIRPGRQERTRRALLGELLSSSRIAAGWMIRPTPAADLATQARELHLPRLLGLLLAAHTVHYGLWILSWWLLGSMTLRGHLDPGWMLAWGLILVSLIPFRILVTYAGGLVAVRGSALLKRRLLFGALRLQPDQVRRLGAGHLLGRVAEAEVLDSMALSGGFHTLTALIELVLALVVLGFGAGGAIHILILAALLVTLFVLARRHLRRRRSWTDHRFAMTNDLVERMAGHRTRLAQEPRDRWNDEEDQALESYLGLSTNLDRTVQWLKVLVPRGWLIAGLLGLAPAFIYGDPSAATLGIGIGGILIAYGALRNLVEGLEQLAAATIAWDRIKLFWEGAATDSPGPQSVPAADVVGDGPAHGTTLIEARDLEFRYPRRSAAVLQGAGLRIRVGEQILLQGQSGGGKSTLCAVLAGLRTPDSGLLLCRGLDRQTLGEDAWRRRVAMAPQFHENHVLMGTVAFNLLMGRRWPPQQEDLDEAEAVCRSLGLGPLLERMPAGLQQMVGETGWQLSHGERSRLYLARALLQGADLPILDESFAALDPETLRASLGFVLDTSPTVLMIAHP